MIVRVIEDQATGLARSGAQAPADDLNADSSAVELCLHRLGVRAVDAEHEVAPAFADPLIGLDDVGDQLDVLHPRRELAEVISAGHRLDAR